MYSRKRIDTIRKMECKMMADAIEIIYRRTHKLNIKAK